MSIGKPQREANRTLTKRFSDFPVLYLEDEVLVSLDIQQSLSDIGVDDLTTAHSYEEAEAALREGSFALAILDINLGCGRSSLDFARELRRRGSAVIFTTGYNRSELPEEFSWAHVLEKPVMFAELEATVQRVYDSRTAETF